MKQEDARGAHTGSCESGDGSRATMVSADTCDRKVSA
jgi:hypothetical protein